MAARQSGKRHAQRPEARRSDRRGESEYTQPQPTAASFAVQENEYAQLDYARMDPPGTRGSVFRRPVTLTTCVTSDSRLSDITSLPDGRLVVADMGARTLTCLSPDGQVAWRWVPELGRSVSKARYIPATNCLLILTKTHLSGVPSATWQTWDYQLQWMTLGGELQGRVGWHIRCPADITAGRGEVYVCCLEDRCVYVMDPAGQELRRFSTGEAYTHLTYLPASDTLVLADWGTHRLQAFRGHGQRLWSYGGRGSGPGQTDRPHGMCPAPDGVSLLLADYKNCRVQWISREGRHIQDVATAQDGLNLPMAVCTDTRGQLCVAEHGGEVKLVSL